MSRISFSVKLLANKDTMKERFSKPEHYLASDYLGIYDQKIEPTGDEKVWKFSFKMESLLTRIEGMIRYKGEKGARIIISNGETSVRAHMRRINTQLQAEALFQPVFEKLFKEDKKRPVDTNDFNRGGLLALGAEEKGPVRMLEPAGRTEMNGQEVVTEDQSNLKD